jgi:hypothetical protein
MLVCPKCGSEDIAIHEAVHNYWSAEIDSKGEIIPYGEPWYVVKSQSIFCRGCSETAVDDQIKHWVQPMVYKLDMWTEANSAEDFLNRLREKLSTEQGMAEALQYTTTDVTI